MCLNCYTTDCITWCGYVILLFWLNENLMMIMLQCEMLDTRLTVKAWSWQSYSNSSNSSSVSSVSTHNQWFESLHHNDRDYILGLHLKLSVAYYIAIYDVHKKIRFLTPIHMRPHEPDPPPLWTSTCGPHEIHIAFLKWLVQWPSGPKAEIQL